MKIQIDYHGKRVFVTDSASGLGRSIAEGFHESGATVAINDPSTDRVLKTIQEMGDGARLIAAPGDLTQCTQIRPTVERAVAAMTQLDVLVCSTVRGDLCPVDKVTADYWQGVLAANVKSAFFTAQACAPELKKTRGCIVNVASVIGLLGGPPGSVVYSTAKGTMIHMSRMMALELAQDGIRVNSFCPGWIDAPAPRTGMDAFGYGALREYIASRSPLGRIATSDECVAAVLYLAASVASYTTGATLIADGGLTSGHYIP